MKKYQQYYAVNNQEDEDSSTHPLYPHTEYIYNKVKKKKKSKTKIKIMETVREYLTNRKDVEEKPVHKFSSAIRFLIFIFLKIDGVNPVTFLNWLDRCASLQ
jgi:hypothetical protein